ncbi:hypothetical protein [Rubinisphaera margarita]|uniref:hypothetical protein n=1 Tax=Rubinisphaera margarita TaxID=2909586 RepID=UPI001EE7E410|nr:hypothetical protein [Rubinisphaera margarita]MCG6155831.1 hypothetical protein [Rubinisphaera margarita]
MLILSLSSTLGYVLWGGSDKSSSSQTSLVTQLATQVVKQAGGPDLEALARVRNLPKFELDQVVSHNPFAPGQTGEDADDEELVAAESETPVAAFDPRLVRVSAVLSNGNTKMALIDNVIYSEGDRLPNGLVVGEITDGNIRLLAE